eukprot:1068534-Pyramimonas_sp.AAC.1
MASRDATARLARVLPRSSSGTQAGRGLGRLFVGLLLIKLRVGCSGGGRQKDNRSTACSSEGA